MQWLSIVILVGTVLIIPLWQRILFNIVFLGYYLFGSMQWAIIFFAFVMRLVFVPTRMARLRIQEDIDALDKKIAHARESIDDPVQQKEFVRTIRRENGWAFNYILFDFCFLMATVLASGTMFYKPFTEERVLDSLFSFIPTPAFPVDTMGWLPIIGEIDFSQVNNLLNLSSAIGLGLVGIMEVVVHNRTSKRDIMLYLIGYPLVGYLVTSNVPSGFEFWMTMMAVLTLVVVALEKVVKFGKK